MRKGTYTIAPFVSLGWRTILHPILGVHKSKSFQLSFNGITAVVDFDSKSIFPGAILSTCQSVAVLKITEPHSRCAKVPNATFLPTSPRIMDYYDTGTTALIYVKAGGPGINI